jgi:hypothetical protein
LIGNSVDPAQDLEFEHCDPSRGKKANEGAGGSGARGARLGSPTAGQR